MNFIQSYFQRKHQERVHATYKEQKAAAIANKDASKLDLILRAEYLYLNAGSNVSTEHMTFKEVQLINPKFYISR